MNAGCAFEIFPEIAPENSIENMHAGCPVEWPQFRSCPELSCRAGLVAAETSMVREGIAAVITDRTDSPSRQRRLSFLERIFAPVAGPL
jgi:hypothetical protein